MSIVLFDTAARSLLYPLTLTRAIAKLQVGIFDLQERWAKRTEQPVFIHTVAYLQSLYPTPPEAYHYWIDARIIPDPFLLQAIFNLPKNVGLKKDDQWIAVHSFVPTEKYDLSVEEKFEDCSYTAYTKPFTQISIPHQLYQNNAKMIAEDFDWLQENKFSQPLPAHNQFFGAENIFIEKGVQMIGAIVNATKGKIYIGENANIMEGALLNGNICISEKATIKMGAKIYDGTTIGKASVAGGEIKNAILMNYSNKAHDGYLGDSVIGAWCNLGAGTSNSNLKNTATNNILTIQHQQFNLGLKAGTIMGDYSKTAINSSLNTGLMMGVGCNYFAAGLSEKTIPNFAWEGKERKKNNLENLVKEITNWKKMKGEIMTENEVDILKYIFLL